MPYDGIPEKEIVSVHLSLLIIYSILSLAGLIYTVICLIFNIVFRNQKYYYYYWLFLAAINYYFYTIFYRIVKLSSPNLNYIIITGAGIMYIAAVLYTIPAYKQITETVLCNMRPRIFSFGYSLCFGTILAKMWRVYYIFHNPSMNKKV